MSKDLALADVFAKFFHEADVDKNGSLSISEVVEAMKKAGFIGTDEDIRRKFLSLDSSGDGKISFEEYLGSVGKQPESVLRDARLRYLFRSYDKDNSGYLEKADIEATFEEYGQEMTEQETARVMGLMDGDKDGKINYEEFLKYYTTD